MAQSSTWRWRDERDGRNGKPRSEEMPMKRAIRIALKLGVAVIVGVYVARNIPTSVRAQLRFPVGMSISVALLCLFSVYWSVAAKDSAPTKTSESKWSRGLHLTLVNGGVLLLILPVPGLTRRFLPDSQFVVAAGLVIEAAFILLAVWARRHLGSNWSGEVRVAAGHQLVRTGSYAILFTPRCSGCISAQPSCPERFTRPLRWRLWRWHTGGKSAWKN